MNTVFAICLLLAPVYLAGAATVGQYCSSINTCSDDNAICKSVSGCADTTMCVCRFGYLWNGYRCLHKAYLKTGLVCDTYSDCMGVVTMDVLTYAPTFVLLGQQCINSRCSCASDYDAVDFPAWNLYGWGSQVCIPVTTTSTSTTPSTSSTSTTSTSTTSTTSTTPTTTTTTSTTTTPTTTTTTTTTTIHYKQYGEQCYDIFNGYGSPSCDAAKGLVCSATKSCTTDISTTTFYCYCPHGYKYCPCSGCKKLDYGDRCNVTSHCSHLTLGFCNDDGVCDAAKPSKAMAVGAMCDKWNANPCGDVNAVCRPNDECESYDTCQCKWGFFFNGHKCQPRSYLKLGQSCTSNADCFYQTFRDPLNFARAWYYFLGHKCRSGKCSCDDSYVPVEAKWYTDSYTKFFIPYDVCTYRPTTTTSTTTTASTTTSTTGSTSSSSSTSTSTTSTTSTTTTILCSTSPVTNPNGGGGITASLLPSAITLACPTGQSWRLGACWRVLVWGDQCDDVNWSSFNGLCDPLKNLVCSDLDQCSWMADTTRHCSCRRGFKQDGGNGCKKIEIGDNCNTTIYCNNIIDGGYCGDNGKCNSIYNAGFTVRPWTTPLLFLFAMFVCLLK